MPRLPLLRTGAATTGSCWTPRSTPSNGGTSSWHCSRIERSEATYGTFRLPTVPFRRERGARSITGRRRLDHLRLRHLFLYLALDRARRQYRPGAISRDLPAEPGRRGKISGSASHPTAETAIWQIA